MTDPKIIQRIKELYALANGGTTESEAMNAIRAAEMLIRKYRLTQAELEETKGIKAQLGFDPEVLEANAARLRLWKRHLISILARQYGVAVIQAGEEEGEPIKMFGRPEDCAICRIQYDRIAWQIERLSFANCKGKGRDYADSYKKGCVFAVYEALRVSSEQIDNQSTSIVKLDSRYDEANSAMRAALESSGRSIQKAKHQASRVHREAYEAGQRDGKHIHYGESVSDGKAKPNRQLG